MEISEKDMKVLLKSQQGELDAVLMYKALPRVQCLELEIEHMTGKLVNE